jgi:site-specific DNA recombinase
MTSGPRKYAALAVAQGEDHEDVTITLARQTIAECDREIARHRAPLEALDESTDPTVIAGWITEAQKQRNAAQVQLNPTSRQAHMSHVQITRLVDELGDQAEAIVAADATGKAELYSDLGLRLTHHPVKRTVRGEVRLNPRTAWVNGACPRGDLNPHAP